MTSMAMMTTNGLTKQINSLFNVDEVEQDKKSSMYVFSNNSVRDLKKISTNFGIRKGAGSGKGIGVEKFFNDNAAYFYEILEKEGSEAFRYKVSPEFLDNFAPSLKKEKHEKKKQKGEKKKQKGEKKKQKCENKEQECEKRLTLLYLWGFIKEPPQSKQAFIFFSNFDSVFNGNCSVKVYFCYVLEKTGCKVVVSDKGALCDIETGKDINKGPSTKRLMACYNEHMTRHKTLFNARTSRDFDGGKGCRKRFFSRNNVPLLVAKASDERSKVSAQEISAKAYLRSIGMSEEGSEFFKFIPMIGDPELRKWIEGKWGKGAHKCIVPDPGVAEYLKNHLDENGDIKEELVEIILNGTNLLAIDAVAKKELENCYIGTKLFKIDKDKFFKIIDDMKKQEEENKISFEEFADDEEIQAAISENNESLLKISVEELVSDDLAKFPKLYPNGHEKERMKIMFTKKLVKKIKKFYDRVEQQRKEIEDVSPPALKLCTLGYANLIELGASYASQEHSEKREERLRKLAQENVNLEQEIKQDQELMKNLQEEIDDLKKQIYGDFDEDQTVTPSRKSTRRQAKSDYNNKRAEKRKLEQKIKRTSKRLRSNK